jgi:tRNA-modifying protein YgfZ
MTPKPAYEAASSGAVLVDRSSDGRLRVTGADRVSWLQGLVTNDVAALTPGAGCYAAYLTPQGRMVSDMRILAFDDSLLLDVPASRRMAVLERFDQFIITEDVTVSDETPMLARLGLHGPAATEILVRALEEMVNGHAGEAAGLAEHQHMTGELGGQPVIIAGAREIGRIGYDLYLPVNALPEVAAALSAAGAVDIDAETWDVLRIEAGRPLFGVDMDTDTIPLEAGIEGRAISETKGCYVGQEVIIRVLHRGGGRVARRLVGLVADPSELADAAATRARDAGLDHDRAPAAGVSLRAAERDVGRVTSAAWSPRLGRVIAMGYVHRDAAEVGTVVTIAADPPLTARVSSLPFVTAPG